LLAEFLPTWSPDEERKRFVAAKESTPLQTAVEIASQPGK
jgi:hypothetical protein